MRFFCFHLMPWVHLPDDFAEQHDSARVTCPNTLHRGTQDGFIPSRHGEAYQAGIACDGC